MTAAAYDELQATPLPIQARIAAILERLQRWPAVSGARPLRGELKGSFRIRTGDYRVVFKVEGETIIVWKIGYRGDIYD